MPDENREFYDWEQDEIRKWFNNQYALALGIKPSREGGAT